jgi:O-antigen ligase
VDNYGDGAEKVICNLLTLFVALALSMTFFGKSIVGIGLGCAVLVSGVLCVRNRPDMVGVKAFFTSREIIAIFVLMVTWIVSATMGLNPDKSIKETAEIIGLIIGGVVIFSGLQTQQFDFKKFFQWVSLGGAFCAGLLTLSPLLGEYAVDFGSSYGSVLAILSPMALVLTVGSQKKTWIWWVCFALMASGVFASGGRTAWVALAVVALLGFIFIPWKSFVKRAVFVGIIIASAFVGLKSYEKHVGDHIFEVRTQAMTNTERPMSGRLTVWQDTISHIQNNNPFFGVGIKGSHELDISKGYGAYVRHVHNAPLEIALETGIVGLTLFAIVIVIFIVRFLKAYFKKKDLELKLYSLAIFLSCVAFGVASLSLTSIFYTWWFLYLVVLIVMLKVATENLRLR